MILDGRACRRRSLLYAPKKENLEAKISQSEEDRLAQTDEWGYYRGMIWHSRIAMFFLLASVFFGGGCGPLDNSYVDEEKEAHFLAGKKHRSNRQHEKALKAFEQSLLVIPNSASAHFQLGSLYLEEEFQNPARAIYHFEKMLHFREDHHLAEEVRNLIDKCKMKIAGEVMPLPGSTRTSEEINRLLRENKELEEDKENLNGKVSQLQGEIGKLKLSLNSMAAPRSSPPNSGGENLLAGQNSPPAVNRALPTAANPPKPPENRRFIKHILDQGDSFYALARKYGSSAKAIQRANPSMHPKRLQIGAVVNIPLSSTFTASTQ